MIDPGLSVVDEEKRKKFESDWRSGQATSIDEYLPSDQSNQYLATLEELVCIEMEFLWSRLSSANPNADTIDDTSSQPTYVEDYTSRFAALNHPEILSRLAEHEAEVRRGSALPPTKEEFKDRFPDFEFDERLFASSLGAGQQARATFQTPIAERGLPREFGSFQLTAVLGRGGMATVYRATQAGIDRELAVKIADPVAVQTHGPEFTHRFMAEAKAAANLTHDHIVPVYEVGEVDGQPYYAMPIIDGGDLADQLSEGPLASMVAAKHVRDASRGMEAAHSSGVLHRDIKPRNLMIDAGRGRTMVADFGLAREITAGEVGSDNTSILEFTRAGQILGTPPYMAPEQIHDARSADARSDVYSLGATLYQAVTGRPPFQASTITETLQQVLEAEVVPPAQLNIAVDRDLETIILKSLDKQPDKRYQSSCEFADDLDRYLDGQPIHARRIGFVGKAVKWCRRNPQVATLTGAFSLALIFGVISTITGLIAFANQQDKTIKAIGDSREGIVEMYTELMGDPVFSYQPGESERRQRHVQKAIKLFEKLAAVDSDHPRLQADLVGTHAFLGRLKMENEGPAEGLASFRAAIDHFQTLTKEQQAGAAIRQAYSDALNGKGEALLKLGDNEGGHKAFEESLAIRTELTAEFPKSAKVNRKFANGMMNLGLAKARLNYPDEASELLSKAQDLRLELLKQYPDNVLIERDSGQGAFNLGRFYAYANEEDKGRAHLEKAMEIFGNVSVKQPNNGSNYLRIARCQLLLASIQKSQDNSEEARALFQYNDELQKDLETLSQHNLAYRMELVELNLEGTKRLLEKGLYPEAAKVSGKTQGLLDHGITTSEEAERSTRVLRARIQHERQAGFVALANKDESTGIARLKTALQRWKEVESRFTDDTELREWMDEIAMFLQPAIQ